MPGKGQKAKGKDPRRGLIPALPTRREGEIQPRAYYSTSYYFKLPTSYFLHLTSFFLYQLYQPYQPPTLYP